MVDKIDPDDIPGPKADMYSDRAKRINSLHRSADDIIQQQNKKRLNISDQVSSLTREQQSLLAQLETTRSEITSTTATEYNTLVRNLGRTIQSLSVGVKNITLDTARATSSAIHQYGKAVGEDININRQNTIAMSLATATPLFGYFAAKFMETDVFKDSATKLKDTVSSSLVAAGQKFRDIFRRKKDTDSDEEDSIPRMQTGGYVKKGGIVEVHAAEVVTPIDKLLKKIDETKSKEIANKLDTVLLSLSGSLVRTEKLIKEMHQDKKDLIGDFFRELKKPKEEDKNLQKQMLKTLSELKVAMVGTASQFEIAFNRTLLQHPTFKNLLMFGQTMRSVVSAPFKALFSLRGGFAGDVRSATQTSNIYKQQVNVLALIYTRGMAFLRNIEKYTKVTAEALVGEEVSPVASKSYTLFGKIKEFMEKPADRKPFKVKAFDTFVDSVGLDRKTLEEAGITTLSDLFNPLSVIKKMGFTKEGLAQKLQPVTQPVTETLETLKEKAEAAKEKARDTGHQATEKLKEKAKFAKEKTDDFKTSVVEKLDDLVNMKRDQEEREGPHSPSMAENIASTASASWQNIKDQARGTKEKVKSMLGIKKATEEQSNRMSSFLGYLKKTGQKIWDWIPMVLNWVFKIGGGIGKIAKTIGNIGKAILMFFGVKSWGALKTAGKAAGGVATGAKAAGAAGGAAGVAKYGLKTGAKIAGRAIAAPVGMAIGAGSALWDMGKAIISGDEAGFVGNFIVRGLAGFLGGTESGAAGATSGALKGAGIGAAIGSIIPGAGTLIGGAIGAMAGGILGFVGGAQISQGLTNALGYVKDLVKGIWGVVTFPVKLLWEGIKSFWVLTKYVGRQLWEKIDEFLSGPGIIGTVWGVVKNIFSSIFSGIGKVGDWVKEKLGGLWDLVFDKEKWTKILKQLTDPVGTILGMFKSIRTWIDEKIEGMPVIGSIYKGAKKVVGQVRGGTLASDLDAALREHETREKPIPPVQTSAEKGARTGILSRARQFFQRQPTPTAEALAEQEVEEAKREKKSFWEPVKDLLGKLNKKMDDQTEKTVVATNKQTTAIISTSQINNRAAYAGGRRGAGPGGYPSGRGVAHQVAGANVQ